MENRVMMKYSEQNKALADFLGDGNEENYRSVPSDTRIEIEIEFARCGLQSLRDLRISETDTSPTEFAFQQFEKAFEEIDLFLWDRYGEFHDRICVISSREMSFPIDEDECETYIWWLFNWKIVPFPQNVISLDHFPDEGDLSDELFKSFDINGTKIIRYFNNVPFLPRKPLVDRQPILKVA